VDWAAGLLSVILACEMGHEPSRVAWTRELCDPARPIPPKLRGFLRDFCILKVDSLYGNYRYLSANPYGMDAPIAGTSTTANAGLPRLDGGLFRTADHAGRTVAFHFWSLACPPRYRRRHKEPPAPDMTPSNTVVVVGVNLDEDRAGVEAFVKDSPEFQGWVHVFSGRGWNDPLAREWDVFSLPRSVWLNSRGQIAGWSRPGMFGGHFKPDG
jgi:hypothetical protein